MIKSPPTPTKKKYSAFPLFDSLLYGGVTSKRDSNTLPKCPATAPVLIFNEPRSRRSEINVVKNMEHTQHRTDSLAQQRTDNLVQSRADSMAQKRTETLVQSRADSVLNRDQSTELADKEEIIKPITLQDPPKSRLKRQLSIETNDRIEATRIYKKVYARQEGVRPTSTEFYPRTCVRTDEVDGDLQSLIDRAISADRAQTEKSTTDQQRFSTPSSSVFSDANISKHIGEDLQPPRRSPLKQNQQGSDSRLLRPEVNDMQSLQRVSPHKQRSQGTSESPTCLPETRSYHPALQGTSETPTCLSETRASYTQTHRPPQSPNFFNLNDIVLTSPFMSTTSRNMKSPEKEVFVFPEAVSQRKLPSYKGPSEQTATSASTIGDGNNILNFEQQEMTQLSQFSQQEQHVHHDPYQPEMRQRLCRDEKLDTEEENCEDEIATQTYPNHVSSKGFIWPKTASVSPVCTFSPRIVTAESKPQFPSSTSTAYYHDDYEQLCILEREHARAKQIFGVPPRDRENCQISPHSREVTEIIRRIPKRSISDFERSPNEKDIHNTNEDVRNKYERSFSDPTFNPRQIRGILQRPSPLVRERSRGHEPELHPQECLDRRKDPWQNDVRRRLFMKGDPYNTHPDYRRMPHDQQVQADQESTAIPQEVLHFLHTRNFHPEDLANLKDILRRSESSSSDSMYAHFERSNSMQYEPTVESTSRTRADNFDAEMRRYGRCQQEPSFTHAQSSRQETGNIRERQLGGIDVRLSVESVTERDRRIQDEILRDLDHDGKDCKCSKIEDEIRMMARDAYSKILLADKSEKSYNQYQNEINETHLNVYNSMRIMCGIKCLCKYGRTLEDIYSGSVVFRINCPNVDSLLDLWEMYKSKGLERLLIDAFVTDELKEKFGCVDIKLKVTISWDEYLKCKNDLEKSLRTQIVTKPMKPSPGLSVIHARSRSEPAPISRQTSQSVMPKTMLSPFRERFCSDSSVELSPRRAFQEINAGKETALPPHSPSRKFVMDNVFFAEEPPRSPKSPLTSSRRKSFGIDAQQEQENFNQSGPITSPITSPRQPTFQSSGDHRISDV